MLRRPGRRRGIAGRLWAALLAAVLLAFLGFGPLAVPRALAEAADDVKFVAPQLPSDVDPYDPQHPEDLQEDQLYAKSAILIEAKSGEVIFEKNPDERMYPASTTKILTVLLGIMMGDMNAQVTMSATAADLPENSSTIPLDVGETINFQDLLYVTLMRSGNEGANLIAETISGNTNDFALLMNQAAAMYGCTGTNFTNPSGLFNNDHYSTARDLAKIAQAAMQNDTFRDMAKVYTYNLPRSNLHRSRVLVSQSPEFLNPNLEDNEFITPTPSA